MGVRGWNWLVGGVMTPPYGVRSGNRVGGRQIAAPFPTAPVGALIKRPLQNRAAILKISAGNKTGIVQGYAILRPKLPDGQWGATRPPPVAGGGRGASGSGRRETMVRQHQGYSPGTATGRPYGVRR